MSSTKPKKKLNVIFHGCRPMGYEIISDGISRDYELPVMECGDGVHTIEGENWPDIYLELYNWWGDNAISHGEEGGIFKVRGGFHGECTDLVEGKEKFITSELLNQRIHGMEVELE